MSVNNIFRALRHRNYRLFFGGQSISLVGTWMQQVALSWLVYRLTNSPFLLGFVGFVGLVPTFICTPLAGVFADRHDRRNMLLVTQSLSMVQAAILAFLVLTHQIQVWQIIVLSAFIGTVNSFDIPIRQAFTVEMIENREDLGNAIALNSSMLNAARLIGPSVAGILIASVGEGLCFLLNALSYIAVLWSLGSMHMTPHPVLPSSRNLLWEFRDGLRYAVQSIPIRWILFLLALTSFMGVSYQTLMPIFAKDIFHRGSSALGFLMAMFGTGALIGALYLASRKSVIGLARVSAWMAGLFGVGMVLFSLSRIFPISMVIILVSGIGMMVHMAACNTILQTIVEEDKRGRVMGFYTMAFMGTAPFGSLLGGTLASWIGAPGTLAFCGTCSILGALLFYKQLPRIRAKIRPIYAQKGILPEVAQGLQSATELGGIHPD
ncbi:MAG TPA: MFS transporter [Candidatus Omnitrophota bacterium]|nr:MFS transporter [Candidatus Omnitrophota bacterium]HPS37707.1 MFS transporter [Candidatus Omnitrophota bacterium]